MDMITGQLTELTSCTIGAENFAPQRDRNTMFAQGAPKTVFLQAASHKTVQYKRAPVWYTIPLIFIKHGRLEETV